MAMGMRTKTLVFGSIYFAILAAVTLAGIEVIATFFSPSWPAYALRSMPPVNSFPPGADLPAWMVAPFNSWGMRDREHAFGPAPAGTVRTVFVGDSFVEFQPLRQSLPEAVEERLLKQSKKTVEAVNFGISGTNPQSYYYRLRDVALPLSPDAVSVFFFSGNDFLFDSNFRWEWLPPLLDESPGRSIVGRVMPHTNWLLVNRLGLSEFGRGNRAPPDEAQKIIKLPRADRLDAMVRLVKTYYYPDKDEKVIREILSRGGDTFWDRLEPRARDEEYIQAWWLASMVDWETATWTIPLTGAELEQSVDRKAIAATMTWLLGARDLARERGIEFVVTLAPVGIVDPSYAEFWAPWPKYMSYPKQRALMHRILRKELEAQGIKVVDLEDDFKGVPNTYRVSDGHWTELGTEIAAKRLAAALGKMRKAR